MNNKPPLTTRLSSKAIDVLIKEFRDGDVEAATKLLECFKPLIGKYLKLFFYGTFDKEDVDVIKFLEACGKKDIDRTAEIIRFRLRRYEASELINIAREALLETASKHNNISSSYRYVLHGYLRNMLWEDFPDGMPLLELSSTELVNHPAKDVDIEIDEDWIKGVTSGAGFSDLTELQRRIVKLCYYDNIPDVHIAYSLGMTMSEFRTQKTQIKNILASELNVRHLLGKRE